MPLYDWESVEKEQLNPLVARKVIHTGGMTLARIYIGKGGRVPEHTHENEQMTILLEGRLRFVIAGQERVIVPGQMIQTPPNLPHWVEAIEDVVALDIFVPRRDDWIRGDDAYLR